MVEDKDVKDAHQPFLLTSISSEVEEPSHSRASSNFLSKI